MEDYSFNVYFIAVLLGLCLCGIIAAVYHKYYYSRITTVKRKLKSSPRANINLCKDGELVKITGKITIIGEAMKAPLSGRKCAYYHVLVEEEVGTRHSRYETIIEKESSTAFLLSIKDHFVLINQQNLLTHLVKDARYSSGFFHDASEKLENFLQENGYSSTHHGFNRTIRYSEGILEEGERVAVAGKARWSDGPKEGLSSDYKKLLVIDPYGNEPVYLSDDPRTLK